jgi:hypothetical protein
MIGATMTINDIHVTGKPLVLAKLADVDALEARLWLTFPDGYRDYVTKLGEGVLGGEFVRIYPPWRIEKELDDWRQRIAKYWFWDKGRALLPKDRAVECVIVGDTVNGDELVFHPTRPNRLFILPRDSEKIFEAGADLWAAVEWMCQSGKLVKAFGERNFAPFDSRKEAAKRDQSPAKGVDPPGESLDELVALAKQWAKRHSARKSAQRDLKESLPDMLGDSPKPKDEIKITLLYEAMVMEGEYPYQPSYLVVFRINDKKSGLELGHFKWHMEDGSSGYACERNEANIATARKTK